MADALKIGLSALITSQHGLATTGHNIANVNTEGYSRQLVTFETRRPQLLGVGYVGKGVDVQAIERMSDQFLVDQFRLASANHSQALKQLELIEQVDRQVGNALVVEGLQGYFDALGDANDNPRLAATRQVLVQSVRGLVDRFAEQERQLNDVARSVNGQIGGTLVEINSLTRAIAAVNDEIARSVGSVTRAPPNDLLDRRDQLLVELSRLVGVQVQPRDDGMVNILVGSGQIVVAGSSQTDLTATTNALDGSRTEVAYTVGGALIQVTSAISGGELGALVDFRDAVLDPARNAVGRLAVTVSLTMNDQHRRGMDLNGALGGDLFSIPGPTVNAAAGNSGSITVAFDATDIGGLEASDYRLRHNGANFTLTRLRDNVTQTLAGAGPFNVDGLTITVTGAPAANDDYLIQPVKYVPRAMALVTTDPSALALASPVRTSSALANLGEARISRADILAPANPALLTTTQIVFNDPPSTYQINGAGPLLPYTSGANISVNGWRVQVTGNPVAGDVFTVQSNAGGQGDNSNGLALSALQFLPILEGGTASYQEAYGSLAGEVGAAAQQSRISSQALEILSENAQATRDALSGVNLEEEAANLLRFQQAFQAAAQVIKTADALFQSLIDAVRR